MDAQRENRRDKDHAEVTGRKLLYVCAGAKTELLPDADIESLLLSTASNFGTEGNTKKAEALIQAVHPGLLMLDSGGYQILSTEQQGVVMTFDAEQPLRCTRRYLNIAPLHVVQTAMEIKADCMIALDFPVRKLKGADECEREFREKIDRNVAWAIETAALRKEMCPDIEFLIPVQAYNLRQFEEFYRRIMHVDCDGLSLPVRNLSMVEIAQFFREMHGIGIRNVHILGSSSLPTIIVCAYMSRLFDRITFDSTSWRMSAQWGEFINPEDLTYTRLTDASVSNRHARCFCAGCQGRTLDDIAKLERQKQTTALINHNYLAIQNLTRKFEKASVSMDFVKRFLAESRRGDKQRILRSMEEIETICGTAVRRAA